MRNHSNKRIHSTVATPGYKKKSFAQLSDSGRSNFKMKYITKHSYSEVLSILTENVCESGYVNSDKKLFAGKIKEP